MSQSLLRNTTQTINSRSISTVGDQRCLTLHIAYYTTTSMSAITFRGQTTYFREILSTLYAGLPRICMELEAASDIHFVI